VHPHRDFWLWTGAALTALALTLVAVAGGLLAAREDYDFWRSPPMLVAYACGALALVCLVFALQGVPFPFARTELPGPPLAVGQESSARDKSEDRVFVDVTPAQLVSHFGQYTSIQAAKLTEAYVGKWMRLSGQLGDVLGDPGSPHLQVTFQKKGFPGDPDYEYFSVYMYFGREWDERFATLLRGTQISVAGQIERVGAWGLDLVRCELEDMASEL
jgi:hypothetical protein